MVGGVAICRVNIPARNGRVGCVGRPVFLNGILWSLFLLLLLAYEFLIPLNVTSLLEPYYLSLTWEQMALLLTCGVFVDMGQRCRKASPPRRLLLAPAPNTWPVSAQDMLIATCTFRKRLWCIFLSNQISLLSLPRISLWLMFTKSTSCSFSVSKLNL